MKLVKVKHYREMSEKGAGLIFNELVNNGIKVLGLATGGTPVGLYKCLISRLQKARFSLEHLHTVNLDEYIGLPADHPDSYHQYMEEVFFQHLDIPADQTHLPDGDAGDISGECRRFEALIRELGGVDLQLLGIGNNGHIGFNEPGSSFEGRTQVVELASSTIEANARYFSDKNHVPKQAVTMGIKTITESRKVLLLASGEEKADAMKALIEGDVSEDIPATVLQRHEDLTVIADEEALSKVSRQELERIEVTC